MKYILQEKFILCESSNILTEATTEEVLSNSIAAIQKIIPEFETKLNFLNSHLNISKKVTSIDTKLSDVKTKAEAISNSLKMSTINAEVLQTEVRQYMDAVDVWYKAIDKTNITHKFDNLIADTKKLLNYTPLDETKLKTAANKAIQINQAIISTFDTNTTKKAETEQQITELKNIVGSITANLSQFKEGLSGDITNIKEHNVDLLVSVYKNIDIVNKKINTEATSIKLSTVASIKDNLTTLASSISTITQNIQTELDKKKEMIDWAARYKECNSAAEFDAFWNSYYSTEWGKNADTVRGFGISFIRELETYGFDEITNPFIKYLKTRVGSDILLTAFKIDKSHYDTLHNCVANGVVLAKDLRGKGEFKTNNVIFNSTVYSMNVTDFLDYIKLQSRFERNTSKLSPAERKVYTANAPTYFANLFYANGNTEEPSATVEITPNSTLRSITQIRQILEQTIGEEQQEVSANEIQAVMSTVTSVDEAKKMLVYLQDYFKSNFRTTVSQLLDKATQAKLKDSNPTFDEKDIYDKKLNLTSQYSDEAVKELLNQLLIKAGLKAQQKGAK